MFITKKYFYLVYYLIFLIIIYYFLINNNKIQSIENKNNKNDKLVQENGKNNKNSKISKSIKVVKARAKDMTKETKQNNTVNLHYGIWTNYPAQFNTKWKKYRGVWKIPGINTCNIKRMATMSDIHFNNIYWQQFNSFYLYNAYYDNRSNQKKIVIITSKIYRPGQKMKCLLFFKNKRKPILTETIQYSAHIPYYTTPYQITLVTCKIPNLLGNQIPEAVSLIGNKCPKILSNLLKVIYETPNEGKQDIAVCHKSLRFAKKDWSLRLIEWLEWLKIFGVNQVFFYTFALNSQMERVLYYYRDLNFVDMRYSTFPGTQPNYIHFYEAFAQNSGRIFYQERLELLDCFYRNMYKYKYIVILDIDEMLVPKNSDNWMQMIDNINKKYELEPSSVATYIMDRFMVSNQPKTELNKLNYTLSHFNRSGIHESNPKCIHATNNVKYITHHNSYGCVNMKRCKRVKVKSSDSYFMHFRSSNYMTENPKKNRENCGRASGKAKCGIMDRSLLKFQDILNQRTKMTYSQIYSTDSKY